MINYINLTSESALKRLKEYIAKQTETGDVHNQLNQFIGKIESSLNELKELKADSGIIFRIQGDTLIGALNNDQKRLFRTNND